MLLRWAAGNVSVGFILIPKMYIIDLCLLITTFSHVLMYNLHLPVFLFLLYNDPLHLPLRLLHTFSLVLTFLRKREQL